MAEEEPKPLNYIPEVILKKRKSNEEWAIRRKQQLEQSIRKIKGDNFVTKKLEQFIREYHDTGTHNVAFILSSTPNVSGVLKFMYKFRT